ncbi:MULTISPECIES: GNAT family N-acetyltransferase [Myroides]|uniref:N-acetyltransferase n=1 Tax=Myroides albus TaxID=2562892 RepID=A0A6I3LPS3_9FLAO|nr:MULTISPECIES: N-acetyltransferase [Myroides]MTG97975.1 N-acetyltransferase [Myroides albus]MVX34987.1 N-acetyltransferase [Myroides sp. LoEW2-1]UVD80266.1 N-acetyltransferase [Myroides albus]
MEIKDNELLRQFECETDTGMLSVEYSLQERKIFLTKLKGLENAVQNQAADFLKAILELVREKKLRVVPTHPKIVSFFRKNPGYKEMLPPGIRI